ncbi:MAG: EamA family transporter [Bacteroidota bacterium]
MTAEKKVKIRHFLILILLSSIWGTSFILIKKGLLAYSPLQVASLRIAIAGVGFIPLVITYLSKLSRKDMLMYFQVGLTGNAIPVFFFALAQTQVSSSVAGIVNSIAPIFTMLIGFFFFQIKVSKAQILGIAVGFIGVLLLILLGEDQRASSNHWYAGFIIIATFSYAFNMNYVKKHFQHVNSIKLTAISFFLCTVPLIGYILLSEIPTIIQTEEGLIAFGYLTLLSFMSTMLALILFYKLIQETSAVFGSAVAYLMPIVALIWGFVDGEYLGIYHFLSLLLILVGVYLIKKM